MYSCHHLSEGFAFEYSHHLQRYWDLFISTVFYRLAADVAFWATCTAVHCVLRVVNSIFEPETDAVNNFANCLQIATRDCREGSANRVSQKKKQWFCCELRVRTYALAIVGQEIASKLTSGVQLLCSHLISQIQKYYTVCRLAHSVTSIMKSSSRKTWSHSQI